jgi:ubiquinone/menaquinone biosynthesis C-methylase UbiE
MGKILDIVTGKHSKVKRNYKKRMLDNKVFCSSKAKKYDKEYWDGSRRFGYGGYKFIEGYWKDAAVKLIKNYNLNNFSKILDIGCGKGFLLYEIKKILPKITVRGIDISAYAVKNSHKEIRKFIKIHKAQSKYPFKKNYFDLAISLGCVHNLEIYDLKKCLNEMSRVSKKQFLMTESYRNENELFNLQCWALTCETFFSPKEWKWVFKEFNYFGDYELIYFE